MTTNDFYISPWKRFFKRDAAALLERTTPLYCPPVLCFIHYFHRYPSEVDMQKIVQCLLTPVFDKFKNIHTNTTTSNNNADQLAVAMINVYSEVSQFREFFLHTCVLPNRVYCFLNHFCFSTIAKKKSILGMPFWWSKNFKVTQP